MSTITTKDGTQIYGWTQFWKGLSMPFYGYTKAWWPDYLPPTFVSRRFSTEPLRVVRRDVKVAGGPIQLEFDMCECRDAIYQWNPLERKS